MVFISWDNPKQTGRGSTRFCNRNKTTRLDVLLREEESKASNTKVPEHTLVRARFGGMEWIHVERYFSISFRLALAVGRALERWYKQQDG